jgi:hypothetical protein
VAELILYAIPAFVLLLVVELLSFKYARDDDLVGYESRDTRTSPDHGRRQRRHQRGLEAGRRLHLRRAV